MKILQVIHGFPPDNIGGSELYTFNLSRELAKQDQVYVFYRKADPTQREYAMNSGVFHGLNVCSINNTFKDCNSFDKTYRNEEISKEFGVFLDTIRPDIVHFGHVTCLSTTLIEEAKKRKIPVIFTLHDFWLICQLGQLLKRDLSLCHGPKESECARCLAPQLSQHLKGTFDLKKNLHSNFRKSTLKSKILTGSYRQYSKFFFLFQKAANDQIRTRIAHVKEICSLVDQFIAPSNFLMKKFIEFGVPKSKIKYLDYGFNTKSFLRFSKVDSEKFRFGYLGTFIPSKGVHVLVEAFNRITSQNAELRIHGRFSPYHPGFEDYPNYLKSLGNNERIHWCGEFNNEDIARILSEIDTLVVPSIWHENSPLTIHEAFLARVPVIASNIGGMAELVQDGVNGLLFRVGDSKDLTRKMQAVLDNKSFVQRLAQNVGICTPLEEHAGKIRELYHSLLN
jgi:glycosyltransferase involved in cell wall biosynthesis